MTKATYHRLLEEMRKIKDIEIPKISKEKLEAARQGDLSENAEYEAAKEKLEFLHNRYNNIQNRIQNPEFIEELNIPGNVVSLGTVVTIRDEENNCEEKYTILGIEDSDAEKNIISYLSPLAKGLIGKKVGDRCKIELPNSIKIAIIKNIELYRNN